MAWFEATLQRCGSRPVVVCTHVRAAGSSSHLLAIVCYHSVIAPCATHTICLVSAGTTYGLWSTSCAGGAAFLPAIIQQLQYSIADRLSPNGAEPIAESRRLTCSTTASPAGARQEPLRMAEPQQQPRSIHPAGGALSQHPPLVLRGVQPVLRCPASEPVFSDSLKLQHHMQVCRRSHK